MKRILPCLLAATLILSGCQNTAVTPSASPNDTPSPLPTSAPVSYEGAINIQLSDSGITVDGEATSSDSSNAVYTANDIVFYLAGQDFTYGEGTKADEHEQSEADAHTVVHITQPGTYMVSGTLSAGQIAIDLGKDAEEDPSAVVTLVLNGVDITCTVAPAVIFYSVYECGSTDEDTASMTVDTSAAGANVVIVDDSVNNVNGSYVARIYKSVELNEAGTEVVDSKKLHKYDGAFYSKMSMNMNGGEAGTGVLNISAENEGLDSELHLTINGGNINITSGNDGINTNEDYISVTTINGGSLTINVTGSTGEGDGIDSNGWLVINGGTVIAAACSTSGDAGIDSDMGIHLNGGAIMASGNMLDRISGSRITYAVFQFMNRQTGGSSYTLKDANGSAVAEWTPANDFTYLIVSCDSLVPGTYTLWQGKTQLAAAGSSKGGQMGHGMGGMTPPDGEVPDDMPEMPSDMPEGGRRPDGERPPQDGEGGRGQFQVNEDGTITLPDGTVIDPDEMGQQAPPDGMGGGNRPGGQMGGQMDQTLSREFVITQGENYFVNVSPTAN